MAFELADAQQVRSEIRRIVLEQVDEALTHLADEFDRDPDAAVHAARKQFKRLRALLRLIRCELGSACYRQEDRLLQEAGRTLSQARDAHVLVKTLTKLARELDLSDDGLIASLQARLEERSAAVPLDREVIAGVVVSLVGLQQRLEDWPLRHEGWPLIEAGALWVYRQGRRAFACAYDQPSAEHFHTWRKRVKDLWHQLELLTPLWPPVLKPLADEAHRLADYLGDEHDLSVLLETLQTFTPEITTGKGALLLETIEKQRQTLQQLARPLGLKLYAETPRAYRRRLHGYWQAWKGEAQETVSFQNRRELQKLA
ncbi:CHAD domain-containing protein [Gloeobacter kilaueensis]|uniref:CHAD domain-containing protein n=1 Tax=Gloeobacter kilaueensis (strain ATCC BAA-2537 / CCAP 1431/1 / ULC 316 / JS1) TaxID=1183438 RepID=U5QQZ3_GLOK1|nr:CHAD domain-containing protein [Gloeobacter kilaueensis]AGY60135.1 hypothetical protein GKIL_3889 [Gloeobacter kilaueensis JS1]